MVEKKKIQKVLKFVASKFRMWIKEEEKEKESNLIDSVYINEISVDNKEPFLSIDIKTKDGVTHKSILGQPMSDSQKKINEKLRKMSEEERETVLENLED